jgi:AcrR family transcriptional regulator
MGDTRVHGPTRDPAGGTPVDDHSRVDRLARGTLIGPKALRTRDLLLEVAKAQFLERGYGETTVEHIAEAAKVSRPTFYTYFRSKRDVLEAVALIASDAAARVFDALGEIPNDWTTDDVAGWVRSYFACQRMHGPWALVWRAAACADNEVNEIGRANRRYHAKTIGKHLRGLGGDSETDPVYDGLIVLAILESLLADGPRVGGSDAVIVDVAARAIETLVRRDGPCCQ